MGEVIPLREYASRKIRLQRVATNEALLRQARQREAEREAVRQMSQLQWRSRRGRRIGR